MEGPQIMEILVDKLCDHLPTERIKLLIESGFDEWETITYMKGTQLVELGYSPEECIIIMVAVNANAKEVEKRQIFSEEAMQKVLALAKDKQKDFQQRVRLEEASQKMQKIKIKQETVQEAEDVKQFVDKSITEAILLKGVTLKGKEKVPLSKITLITLEEKDITHIAQMSRVPQLQNLYLGHNHIYHIEGLQNLHKLKILKLEKGLNNLQTLEQIFLNDNHLSKLEGLTNNKNLHFINISNQKSKRSLVFEEQTCSALGYCLETMYCDGNRVQNISSLKDLKVINSLSLKNNSLNQMGDLSQPLGSMERLKILDFRGNALANVPKYRDYIVILAKNLQQLDTKKILPTERQYLVKLYSLKHAKQMRQQGQLPKKAPQKGEMELQVTKLQQGSGQYVHGSDLRGNAPYANTKIHKK